MSEPSTDVSVPNNAAPPATAEGSMAIEQQRAIAEVQGQIISAKKFPRDVVAAVERIKNACQRPSLAAMATYDYAKGGTNITGPSIRLLEEIARNWGNISCGVVELSRSNGVSQCMAFAWDMETNFRDVKQFSVPHRRTTRSGSYALTDDREIYEAMANVGARRKRACLEAVIPGDVVEDAVLECEATLKSKIKITPVIIEKMLTGLAKHGVTQKIIEDRIQRKIEAITPAQMVNMSKIATSLNEGMSVIGDWFKIIGPATTATHLSFSKAEMDTAKHQVEERVTTVESILERHPNLSPAQVDELRAVEPKE